MYVAYALAGAYSAMVTYLDHDSDPGISAVYGRAVKLSLLALVPGAVAFGVLAGPLCELFFGPELRDAAEPLEFLAPVVVLLGLVIVSTSLIVSRRTPSIMVWATAAMVVLNVALNFALIPSLEDSGAALSMLITESVFLVVLILARREVGSLAWLRIATGPLVAGAVMAVALVAAHDELSAPLALIAGSVVYLIVLIPLERRVAPADYAFASGIVRRRIARG